MHQVSNWTQLTSNLIRKKSGTWSAARCVTSFLPHFDVHCDSITAQNHNNINLFVLYVVIYACILLLSSDRSEVRTNQNACINQLIIWIKNFQMDFNDLASCPTAQYFWQFCFAYIILMYTFWNLWFRKLRTKKCRPPKCLQFLTVFPKSA